MTISISNLKYSEPTNTLIDMEVMRYGETFPFTYSPTDPAEVSVAVRQLLAENQYEIAEYVVQPPVVPQSVSAMQAKVALSRAGLLSMVETWISGRGGEEQLIWNTATVFNRNSELIANAALALRLSKDQVDSLFVTANEINP